MRQIHPAHADIRGPGDLISRYAYPESTGRPYLRANMVATVDGAAWGVDGRSGSISSGADRAVFEVLRGLADVILVGAATARVEHYGPAVATTELVSHRASLSQQPDPAIAVVSRALDLDPTSPLFAEARQATVVVTSKQSPATKRDVLAEVTTVVVAGDDDVDLAYALAALAELGYLRVLCEGGPNLLAHVVQHDLLDELCLTVSPRLVGGPAGRILAGAPVTTGDLDLVHVLEADGTLLTRWRRQPAPSTSVSS